MNINPMGAWEYATLLTLGIDRAGKGHQILAVTSVGNDQSDPEQSASTMWTPADELEALNALGALGWEVTFVERMRKHQARKNEGQKTVASFEELLSRHTNKFLAGTFTVEWWANFLLKRPAGGEGPRVMSVNNH